jgi:Rps23 Pro-64 3,4-dihydroxylase Tpa1-like proline 4-hydroxylase
MLNNNYALALAIKNIILTNFLHADIEITFDKEQDEYFISTQNKEIYYSQAYGMLLLEINQNILWKQGIFNFHFTLNVKPSQPEELVRKMTFDQKETNSYLLWNVCDNQLPVNQSIWEVCCLAAA